MKLSILMILLLPKSASYILDGSQEATVPSKKVPADSARRAATAPLLAPLLLLPPALPAWAYESEIKQLMSKVDAMGADIKELKLGETELKLQVTSAKQDVFWAPALTAGIGVFGTAVAAALVAIFAKQDVSGFATKEDVSTFSTKTKDDFAAMHAEVSSFATKTTEDLAGVRSEVAGVASQLKKLNTALKAVTKKPKKQM
jgi:hypothetical protein